MFQIYGYENRRSEAMLDFTTKEIESSLKALMKEVSEEMANTPDYVAIEVDRTIEEMKRNGRDTQNIYKYKRLIYTYASCAQKFLLVCNDKQRFKGCCYLAARAGEICFILYDKGHRDVGHYGYLLRSLQDRSNTWYYAHFAILANCRELAVRIALEDTLLGAVLMQDYERAKRYLPESIQEIKNLSWEKQVLCAIAYQDEKKMNRLFEKEIRELRRQTKLAGATYFDGSILAFIKLAQKRNMTCDINVAEVPWHLLDDNPINEDEWHLPEDNGLEQLLKNEKK